MDAQIIQTMFQQQKLKSIFLVDIRCQLYGLLIKVTKIENDFNEIVVTLSYKIKFIDSPRFVASLLSNLVDNLGEGIHKIKCKDSDCFLEYESVKDTLIKCKCLSCNENYSKKLDGKLKK